MSFSVTSRENNGVMVFDLNGRITLGAGTTRLHDLIREQLANGHLKILFNLQDTNYMDSSGLGELVSGYRAVKGRGGEMKLMNLNKKVMDLLQITKLYTIFDIHSDEKQAVESFKA